MHLPTIQRYLIIINFNVGTIDIRSKSSHNTACNNIGYHHTEYII